MKKYIRKKNCNRLYNHFVYIGIFDFLGGRLKYEQFLFHSCLPFLQNLGKVIHFYKFEYVDLIKTNLRFLQFFLLVTTY
jgi:hypothetical protein